MVSQWSIIFMIMTIIISVAVPIIALIYFKKTKRMTWKPVLVGILIFIIFSQILEKLLHVYMLQLNVQTAEWLKNPYLYALYGGLAAALFEEGGRLFGYLYLLKKYRAWKDGIAYGIGHGGMEAILIGGVGSIQYITFSFLINSGGFNQVLSTPNAPVAALTTFKNHLLHDPSYYYLLGSFERLFAFILQLALSVLVLYAVKKRKAIIFWLAVLIHFIVDFLATLTQSLKLNIFLTEGFLLVIAVLSIVFLLKSKAWFSPTDTPSSESDE